MATTPSTQPNRSRCYHRRYHRLIFRAFSLGISHSVRPLAFENHSRIRGWKLWIANPRTNHVHVVVTAVGYAGDKVRDQLKANCTRGIREVDQQFADRPVWTTKGDVEFLETETIWHLLWSMLAKHKTAWASNLDEANAIGNWLTVPVNMSRWLLAPVFVLNTKRW